MTEPFRKAPGWRRLAGGLLDMAIMWPVERRLQARAGRRVPVALILVLVREQVGTPGHWLFGVRTVDRRSGERVALWRSVALAATGWGGQLLVHRLAPPGPGPEQKQALERYWQGLREIAARHPDDPVAAQEERARLAHPPPLTVDIRRAVVPMVAVGVLTNRLRRLLAPTAEALTRRRAGHLTDRTSGRSPRA